MFIIVSITNINIYEKGENMAILCMEVWGKGMLAPNYILAICASVWWYGLRIENRFTYTTMYLQIIKLARSCVNMVSVNPTMRGTAQCYT